MKTDRDIIVDFLTQMQRQDNRSTAAPYFYTIRQQKKVYVPTGFGSECDFYCDGDFYESDKAAMKSLLEYGHKRSEVEKLIAKGNWVDFKMEYECRGFFLTETDADNHLRCNPHHYSSDAHTYIDHIWRAPELEAFFMALFKEYKIELGNWGR